MSKIKQKDKMGINGKFNENKTRMNSYLLHQIEDKTGSRGLEIAVGWCLSF